MTVVTGEGDVHEDVGASLTSPDDPLDDLPWFGKLTGDLDAFDLMEGTQTLRLPDGRESTFRLSRTDLALPRGGIDVVGTAPPPF